MFRSCCKCQKSSRIFDDDDGDVYRYRLSETFKGIRINYVKTTSKKNSRYSPLWGSTPTKLNVKNITTDKACECLNMKDLNVMLHLITSVSFHYFKHLFLNQLKKKSGNLDGENYLQIKFSLR